MSSVARVLSHASLPVSLVSSVFAALGSVPAPTLVLNPLRSEREAFRFLIYVVVVAALIGVLVVVGRAIL